MIGSIMNSLPFKSSMYRILSVLLLLAATGWFGCDSNTSPRESEQPLQTQWEHQYDMVDGIRTPPTVVGDSLVLFSGAAQLTALHIKDGGVKWHTPLGSSNEELYCAELKLNDESAFCTHINQVLAWDLESGKQLWKFVPPSRKRIFEIGRYSIGEGYFYSGASVQRLVAIDQQSGQLAYERQYEHGPRSITYDRGSLYLAQAWAPEGAQGQSQGGVMKVDAANGDSLWNFRTERGGFYRMRPLVDDGVVYAGTRGGDNTVFVALDAQTGEVIWRNTRARVYAAEMADGKIFVNDGSDLLALNKETGRTLWRARLEAGHGESGLAYLDGYVYHPHGRALRVVNAETGEIVPVEAPPDGSYFWEVGVGAGKVFAQSSNYLVAYEPFQPE